jgi:hypothetical protein
MLLLDPMPRPASETIPPENLARVFPLAYAHVIPNGTYQVRRCKQHAQPCTASKPYENAGDFIIPELSYPHRCICLYTHGI